MVATYAPKRECVLNRRISAESSIGYRDQTEANRDGANVDPVRMDYQSGPMTRGDRGGANASQGTASLPAEPEPRASGPARQPHAPRRAQPPHPTRLTPTFRLRTYGHPEKGASQEIFGF